MHAEEQWDLGRYELRDNGDLLRKVSLKLKKNLKVLVTKKSSEQIPAKEKEAILI